MKHEQQKSSQEKAKYNLCRLKIDTKDAAGIEMLLKAILTSELLNN